MLYPDIRTANKLLESECVKMNIFVWQGTHFTWGDNTRQQGEMSILLSLHPPPTPPPESGVVMSTLTLYTLSLLENSRDVSAYSTEDAY